VLPEASLRGVRARTRRCGAHLELRAARALEQGDAFAASDQCRYASALLLAWFA